jgi:fatty-acyl-CoA synthase
MLAYDHGADARPLLGETIGANLRKTAAEHSGREALVSAQQGVRLTYAELDAAVDGLATGLMGLGVARGDRIGVWSPNCAEWVLFQYAAARLGAILVNLNPAYRTHELAYAIRQSGTRLVAAMPEFKTSDYRGMLDEVAPGLPGLERVLYFGEDEWLGLAATAPDHVALDAREAALGFDDPINIQYTSGTTGAPKGATLTHHNILNNGYFVGELLGYTAADRVCIPVPFYHCFGMVMGNLGATCHGAAIVIPAPAFDPGATLQAVQDERCTSLYGVPTMFIAELDHPRFAEFALGSLRTGIMAGAPCPVEVMKRVVADMNMGEVSICCGMTETSPVSTQTRRDDSLERRVGSIGQAGPHIEIKIVDPETGLTVERGETGEQCTRGYSVMLGYWEEPDKTAGTIDAAGWMHTGDLATMDAEGYCNIVGRIKDMVIRGGENLYPREIEEFLFGHPDVADVQVVGVPDERYGEELCAWVRLREGGAADEASIRAFCDGRIARHKVPRYVLFVDEFPMTVTGKVQKYKIREESVRLIGLEDAAGVATA